MAGVGNDLRLIKTSRDSIIISMPTHTYVHTDTQTHTHPPISGRVKDT